MVEGMNSTMIYLMYGNNFYECHNVPPLSTTIKNITKIRKKKKYSLFSFKTNVLLYKDSEVYHKNYRI
jgi:hypothetical protein